MSKINLQEPQRYRNATANFVNLIRTSTVTQSKDSQRWKTNNFVFALQSKFAEGIQHSLIYLTLHILIVYKKHSFNQRLLLNADKRCQNIGMLDFVLNTVFADIRYRVPTFIYL